MKAPRLVLIGLGTLVLALVAWLQYDPKPKPASTSKIASRPDRSPTLVPTEVAGPIVHPAESQANATNETATDPDSAAPTGLARALALPPGFERRQLVERFGFDAAKDGLATALQTLAGIVDPADRQALLRGIFARASEGSLGDAIHAVKALHQVVDRETAVAALVEQWRPKPQPLEAQRALAEQFGAMGGILSKLLDVPSLAAECANGLLSGFDKVRFLGVAAGREAARDPVHALSFGEGLAGKERQEFLVRFAAGWANVGGEAAWAWSLQEPDAAVRQAVQASVLQGWAEQDPQSAALYLAQIENPEARQKAIHAVGASWASADTQAALAWANSLANPTDRDAAVSAISSEAPVGIGVVLRMGDNGYPVVGELVPGGPASLAGGMHDGYQIAAISDGLGGFTDLRGKNMADIVSLIRGKPGSNVYLQVVEPGGNLAAPRTITVTRQQLMFKRSGG